MTRPATVDELLALTGTGSDGAWLVRENGLTDEIVRGSRLGPDELVALFKVLAHKPGRSKEAKAARRVVEGFLDGVLPAELVAERTILLQFDVAALEGAAADLTAVPDPEDEAALTAEEAAALRADTPLLLEVLGALLGNWLSHGERVAPTLRCIRAYGRAAAEVHRPSLLLLLVDGEPVAPEGARFLKETETLIRERANPEEWRFGSFSGSAPLNMRLPSGKRVPLRREDVVRLHRRGLSAAEALDLLAASGYDAERALGSLQDGITPVIAEGWL